jgi:hypothetical protein
MLIPLVGCGWWSGDPDGVAVPDAQHVLDAPPEAHPALTACKQDITLTLGGTMSQEVSSLELGTGGETFCLTLDASARTHPTAFGAQASLESGTRSAYHFALFDGAGTIVEDGYDAPISSSSTYATVGHSIETAGVYTFTLQAWARETPGTTTLALSLFQVLD